MAEPPGNDWNAQLAVRSRISGDLLEVLPMKGSWTAHEVTLALRLHRPAPHLTLRLFVGNEPMDPRRTLEQLGVTEVQFIQVDYLADQHLNEQWRRMEEDLQHLTPEVLYDLGQERSPPHEDLCLVLRAVALLVQPNSDLSWLSMRRMLCHRGNFRETLRSFCIDDVPFEVLLKFRDTVAKAHFDRDRLRMRNLKAGWLSSWVLVMYQFVAAKLDFYGMGLGYPSLMNPRVFWRSNKSSEPPAI